MARMEIRSIALLVAPLPEGAHLRVKVIDVRYSDVELFGAFQFWLPDPCVGFVKAAYLGQRLLGTRIVLPGRARNRYWRAPSTGRL